MTKRMVVMLAATAAFVGGIGLVKFRQVQAAIAQASSFQPPPEAVTTTISLASSKWNRPPSSVVSVRPLTVTLAPLRGRPSSPVSIVRNVPAGTIGNSGPAAEGAPEQASAANATAASADLITLPQRTTETVVDTPRTLPARSRAS